MKRAPLWLLCLMMPLSALAAEPANVTPARTVTVSSEYQLRRAPDRVTVQIAVQEQAKLLADAQKRTNQQLRALEAVAKEIGIPPEKIQTNSSSTQPNYRWEQTTNKRIFEGYIVSHQISLVLDAPDKLGALMEKLTAAGIDEINNVQYGLKDEQAARTEALAQAAAAARAKAEKIASAMGEKLGRLLNLNEQGTSYQPMPMPMMRMAKGEAMMASAPAPSPPAGGIDITTNLQATFALQD